MKNNIIVLGIMLCSLYNFSSIFGGDNPRKDYTNTIVYKIHDNRFVEKTNSYYENPDNSEQHLQLVETKEKHYLGLLTKVAKREIRDWSTNTVLPLYTGKLYLNPSPDNIVVETSMPPSCDYYDIDIFNLNNPDKQPSRTEILCKYWQWHNAENIILNKTILELRHCNDTTKKETKTYVIITKKKINPYDIWLPALRATLFTTFIIIPASCAICCFYYLSTRYAIVAVNR